MAKKPPKSEGTPRRPIEPRVTVTTKGLHALLYFVDKLGHPDQISPDSLVFAWPEAGAILIVVPDQERCALRDDHDEAFFELFGWCVYHHIELSILAPEEFDEGFESNEDLEERPHAVNFLKLLPDDVAAFQDVVRGRGGVCMSDSEFHGKTGPEENPEKWPDTGILVVYPPGGEDSAGHTHDTEPTSRNATLYAYNEEWLRTTVEALRKLVESHGPDGRKVQ